MESTAVSGHSRWEPLVGAIENAILWSRFLLLPILFALLYVILRITYGFFFALGGEAEDLSEHTLLALQLLDITMITNLVWLIAAGSYYVFIDSHYPLTSGKRRPRCLAHVSTGILKEKLAGSLIGVSSVHLLGMFLKISTGKLETPLPTLGMLLAIHVVFIIGLLAFNHANAADHHNHSEEEKKGATNESH